MEPKQFLKGRKLIPPANITKENLGIWNGWTFKSDREVAREAGAKGHVDLAIEFLCLRKSIPVEEAKSFIKDEISKWVNELLERKQIFRVSHILKNIDVDPVPELIKVFYNTDKKDLRDYIGGYLQKSNFLSEEMQNLWQFLDVILKNSVFTVRSRLRQDSIQCLSDKSNLWKNEMACKLILRTQDLRLLPFFNAEILWEQLLAYNDMELLKMWINVTYSEGDNDNLNISQPLFTVFQSFPVTYKMLNKVQYSDCSSHVRDAVLNEFGRFGVFCDSEINSLISVCQRINTADSIANIYEILKLKHSNLPLEKYLELLVNYCLDNNLLTVLNNSTKDFDLSKVNRARKSADLDLVIELRRLCTDFNETSLRDNIFNVAKYLSSNVETYFCDNPILFLSLLMFSENLSVINAMKEKSLIIHGTELFNVLEILMHKYKILFNIYNRYICGVKNNLTFYDLFEKHVSIDVKTLFSFRYNNEQLPNFNSPDLVEKYGYSKKVNYMFYLRQCRPSIAYKQFKISEKVVAKRLKTLRKKVFKTAIMNIDDIEITSSCIAFLEMIGVSSEYLRVCLHSAGILLNFGMDSKIVISLFLKIDEDPKAVQNLIESAVVETIDFKSLSIGSNFVNAVSDYEVVFKFCVLSHLSLPELFLKHCAYENLWLPFLLYAQMKNYPIPQIKTLISYFKNPNMIEHIVHSVINDIQIEEPNTLMKERDSRKYYLSRIGVRKTMENANQNVDSSSYSKSESSFSLSSGHSSLDSIEIDVSNVKTTLLHTLIRCHNSTDPPRAFLQACQLYKHPFLAIVATCYEPDSVITSWIAWLSVATNFYELFTNFEALTMAGELVADLLNKCMKNRFPRTLLESFLIFIPENPLRHFMEFLNMALMMGDLEQLKSKLELFNRSKNQRRSSVLSEKDYEMTYLKNKTWLENISLQLLASALEFNTNSTYQQEEFVEMLCKLNFEEFYNMQCPNFHCLLKILRLLFGTNVRLDICRFFDVSTQKTCISEVINELLKQDLFEAALEIARNSNVSTDIIVLKKWQQMFDQRDTSDLNFLYECDNDFTQHHISPEAAVSFFMERLSVNDMEKYILLKMSHKWAKTHNLSNQYELEKKQILAFMNMNDYSGNVNELTELDRVKNLTFKELLELVESIEFESEELDEEHSVKMKQLLNDALDKSNFWLALKIEKFFDCKSSDIDILKCCYKLAEKLIGLEQLDTEQKMLVSKVTSFHKMEPPDFRKNVGSATERPNYNLERHNSETLASRNVLSAMHCLTEKLEHGIELAHSLLMLYRISINIEVPYYVVVSSTDQMKMLKDALDDDCMNKLEVVHDFVTVFKWTNQQVSDLFCEEIINATIKYVKSKTENFILWNIDMNTQFHLILKLLKDDSSCLAYKLFRYSNALYKAQLSMELDFKISELALIVELLIVAHNCFTADCNMEGISLVLRKCRSIIAHLVTLRSWKLIVRLFIGIARYSEMDYVFQLLKEYDQFEFLLRKGSRKDDALKEALLEYLKKFCPDNKELFKMVALHFTLYSEVAELWEQESDTLIHNLIEIAKLDMENNRLNPDTEPYIVFPNDTSTKKCLDKLMENFTHATEFHMQGEKLTRAMNAVKQAELTALQKSMFRSSSPTAICLFHLSKSQIISLISKELSCCQSRILVQAYNFQPDWASILFEQCIIRSNNTYLEEFMEVYPFGESLVQDISRKFITANINTPNEIRNMKNIVRQLISVHAKYRIASELGFTDVVEDLLVNGQLAYLKDTVWKKGFKSSS